MTYQDFLQQHAGTLVWYYVLNAHTGAKVDLPEPPEHTLSEAQRKTLFQRLVALMPAGSYILTLWHWDIRFEQELDREWFFTAAFGPRDTVERCATTLADYFLEEVLINEIDVGQPGEVTDEDFKELVRDEAIDFVRNWRANIFRKFASDRSSTKP